MLSAEVTTPTRAKILIVEDEGLIARDIQSRVRKAGYAVAGVVDAGEDVLGKVTETAPDLILMDIRLRGKMDGIEAARQVLERYDLPIIFLTAFADRETLDRAKVTGPWAYLAKPIAQASLPTSIEVALYRHRMQAELQRERAWLKTTLQTMRDAVIVTDRLGRVHYLNSTAERLTGWTASEARDHPLSHVLKLFQALNGQRFDDFSPGTGEDKSRQLPSGLKLVTRGDTHISVEGEIALSTGDGARMGLVVTIRDVTLREQQEQERRHDQKMEAVGRLAAGVAHDFNNFLTVILGHAGLLLGGASRLEERVRKALEEIQNAAATAATVTRQLLTFSRNQVAQPRLLSLSEVVERNAEICRTLLGEGVAWEVSLEPRLKPVLADAGHLAQVLVNLVANAGDAMPDGGTLTVSTANVEQERFLDVGPDVEDHVVLTVTDTGKGMDAGVAEHIFEPFYTTKPVGRGTGLGLSIVYNIVNDLGGVISVDSRPGGGTTFRVFLPAAGDETKGRPNIKESAEPCPDHPKTVLLVDDNAAVRTVMRLYLEGENYHVLEAEDGHQALGLAALYTDRIDVLITDVVMPRMNGFRLAEELVRVRPYVKPLFVSGYSGKFVTEGHAAAANGRFLQKPFLRDELLTQIEQLFAEETQDKSTGTDGK